MSPSEPGEIGTRSVASDDNLISITILPIDEFVSDRHDDNRTTGFENQIVRALGRLAGDANTTSTFLSNVIVLSRLRVMLAGPLSLLVVN